MSHTLLIANGDPTLCYLYGRFLAERGYIVESSPDGLDCMEKLRRIEPSAVVLDADLPWGGGDGVVAWLREQRPTHEIPVIMIGAGGNRTESAEFVEPPVVAHLPKPLGLMALLVNVRAAVAIKEPVEATNSSPVYSELFIG